MSLNAVEREVSEFISNTPKSKTLQNEATKYLPGGSSRATSYFDPYPTFIDHGEGQYIYDVDGNKYLDFMINATTLILGHANPKVVNALQNQASKGTSFSGPTQSQIRLAKILSDRIPSVETVRFVNSGTEGTLNAIRAARAYTGKHRIAIFEGGYHGAHEYVSISVKPSINKLNPDNLNPVPEFPGQPPSVSEDVLLLPYNDLENSVSIIKSHKEELACIIMEAVSSSFGYHPANVDFLKGIREITKELNILLIFDEVQSFRMSPGGAQEYFDVVPDLTCLGKIVGGGLPAGAFGGRRDIMELFDPSREGGAIIPHAGTFNANPMTMVAGETTLNELTPEVYERLNRLGEILRLKLRAVFDELDVPVQITGVSSFFGIHFNETEITDYRSTLRDNAMMNKALFIGLLNEGILLQQGCAGALNALTTEAEIDTLVDAVGRVTQRIR